MRSFDESLKRLQLDSVDVLHLHDPDNHPDHFDQARRGAIKAMIKLKENKSREGLSYNSFMNSIFVDVAIGDIYCTFVKEKYTYFLTKSFFFSIAQQK